MGDFGPIFGPNFYENGVKKKIIDAQANLFFFASRVTYFCYLRIFVNIMQNFLD